MCSVNDRKRTNYDNSISKLQDEYEIEKNKMHDLKKVKEEVEQLVVEAQGAIDNLNYCDFGGDKIISSVKTSQKGYINRMEYYDRYIMLCQKAQKEISEEIDNMTITRNAIPTNCGKCAECLSLQSDLSQ